MGANQNAVLMAVLECGTSDLCMLDDIGYDLGEMVEEMIAGGIKPTLNTILGDVFRRGVEELEQLINDRICELEAVCNERDPDEDEESTLATLRSLTPWSDISWHCNCLDTGIYFCENEEIYREYLPEEISRVEDNMGFSMT